MVDAVAKAAGVPAADVRRAAMLAGDLGRRSRRPRSRRRARPRRFRLDGPAARAADARADRRRPRRRPRAARAPAAVEWKLDGARIQVHRLGGEVRAFTRNLADVTERVPEVVEAVLALPVERSCSTARRSRSGRRPAAPVPGTMRRFGSRLDVGGRDGGAALRVLLRRAARRRRGPPRPPGARAASRSLERVVPEREPGAAGRRRRRRRGGAFLADALEHGHEGVMVKALDAPYEAGRRGAGWLKVKPAHTLDLVVLAAEWGHGRRQGWLSNLHLGARDPADGRVRHAREDLQGADRRDARLADRAPARARRRSATGTSSTCARSSWSRSPSTACRRAAGTRAASRCASRG